MRGHADAETLAAFREELLSRRKAARMSAHLAECPRCAGLDAQLTEVTGLLTRSTAPPMPDALTARIEAAIAAEAAARAATTADGAVAAGTARAGGGAGAGAGARDGAAAGAGARDGAAGGPGQRAGRAARPPAPGRARLALRVAAVTAAVVVVAGGGYGVSQLLSGNPGSSTTAGSAAVPAPRTNSEAPRMAAGGLSSAPGAFGPASVTASGPRTISSGTNYQPAHLKSQVSAMLVRFGRNATASAAPGPAPDNPPASSVRQLPACVMHVTGGKRPLLVDIARYQGHPAAIIVVPATPGTLQALVVPSDCTAAAPHVLRTITLPAPR